jgi:hypothetical protein
MGGSFATAQASSIAKGIFCFQDAQNCLQVRKAEAESSPEESGSCDLGVSMESYEWNLSLSVRRSTILSTPVLNES